MAIEIDAKFDDITNINAEFGIIQNSFPTIEPTVTPDSNNPVTSKGIYEFVKDVEEDMDIRVDSISDSLTREINNRESADLILERSIDVKQDKLIPGAGITIGPDGKTISATATGGNVDDVKVNGESVVTDKVANVTVPTKTSDITNDSGFITSSDVPAPYDDTEIREEISGLDDKIKELELFKYPNVTIIGTPIINNGQISGFSSTSYLKFPFLVDFKNQPFEINMCFTTSGNVVNQENIFDSDFGLAFAIRSARFVIAISTNGTSWDLGEGVGTLVVTPNTTYYVRLSWDGSQYVLSYSLDGTTYVNDIVKNGNAQPYPKQIYIGVGENFASIMNYFTGIINLNNANVKINGEVIWAGMDDAGLSTRADVSLSNIDADGEQKIKEVAETTQLKADLNELDIILDILDLSFTRQGYYNNFGVFVSATEYLATEILPLTGYNNNIRLVNAWTNNNVSLIAWFDEDKHFISNIKPTSKRTIEELFSAPNNAKYVGFSKLNMSADYYTFFYADRKSYLQTSENSIVTINNTFENVVLPLGIEYVDTTISLLNVDNWSPLNYTINGSKEINTASYTVNWRTSGVVRVKPNSTVVVKFATRFYNACNWYLYKDDGTSTQGSISGNVDIAIIEVPSDCNYIGINYRNTNNIGSLPVSIDGLAFSNYDKNYIFPRIVIDKPFKGMKILNLGDSIFGNDRTENISEFLAEYSGATVYNGGFGGTRMSNRVSDNSYEAFDGLRLVTALTSGDWSFQDACIGNVPTVYFPDTLAMLKSLDMSTIDIITLAWGVNDWTGGKTDTEITNALGSIIDMIQTTYPKIRILVCTPIWSFGNGDTDTTEKGGRTLPVCVKAIEDKAKAKHVSCLNSYENMPLSNANKTYYFDDDNVHLNSNGNRLYAHIINGKLNSIF